MFFSEESSVKMLQTKAPVVKLPGEFVCSSRSILNNASLSSFHSNQLDGNPRNFIEPFWPSETRRAALSAWNKLKCGITVLQAASYGQWPVDDIYQTHPQLMIFVGVGQSFRELQWMLFIAMGSLYWALDNTKLWSPQQASYQSGLFDKAQAENHKPKHQPTKYQQYAVTESLGPNDIRYNEAHLEGRNQQGEDQNALTAIDAIELQSHPQIHYFQSGCWKTLLSNCA